MTGMAKELLIVETLTIPMIYALIKPAARIALN